MLSKVKIYQNGVRFNKSNLNLIGIYTKKEKFINEVDDYEGMIYYFNRSIFIDK